MISNNGFETRESNGLQFVQKQLILEGYSVIQHCTDLPYTSSWYTEDVQLLFVKSGSFEIRNGKNVFTISKHQLVLLKKNILVECNRITEAGDEKVEYIRFAIKYDLIKEFTRLSDLPVDCGEPLLSVIVRQSAEEFVSFMGSFNQLLQGTTKPIDGWIKIKMLELFFHLSAMDKTIFEHLLDVREHYRTNITSTVEENIMNAMSVEQLAALSGRSLSSFRRDFLAIYRMPPSQWIRLKRLEKAKQLLMSTTMSITDICYTLGFENIAHFSRLFKAHNGCCPSDYKAANTRAA